MEAIKLRRVLGIVIVVCVAGLSIINYYNVAEFDDYLK